MNPGKDILLAVVPPSDSWLPNLGIGYLQSYLRERGFSSAFLDLNLLFIETLPVEEREVWVMRTDEYWRDPRQRARFFERFREAADALLERILSCDAPLVGFHVHSLNHNFAVELARRLKERAPEKNVIFGGPGVTDPDLRASFPEWVDYCVVNEGEVTLAEVCAAARAGDDIAQVAGVHINLPGGKSSFTPRECMRHIDRLPFPSFDGFPMDKYWGKRIPILLSRGCIGRCSFCDVYSRWKGYRGRGAEEVFREITHQVEKTGWTMLHFNDSLVNANIRELEKLCDMLIENDLGLQIEGLARARREMTPALFEKMKAAGFWKLQWGIETASQRVMELMNKAQFGNVEVVRRNLAECHAAGITTAINIIVGFPGESRRNLRETIRFVLKNSGIIDQVDALNPCEALPVTDVTMNPSKYGITFPGGEKSGHGWVGRNGSTYARRLRRKAKVIKALAKTKLNYGFDLAPEVERAKARLLRNRLRSCLVQRPRGKRNPA